MWICSCYFIFFARVVSSFFNGCVDVETFVHSYNPDSKQVRNKNNAILLRFYEMFPNP